MEHKKQLLIKVLTKLKPYRNLAEGISALVESKYAEEKTIDGVMHIIGQSIKKLKNDADRVKLQKGLEKIQQIKVLEKDEKMSEEELDLLLTDI